MCDLCVCGERTTSLQNISLHFVETLFQSLGRRLCTEVGKRHNPPCPRPVTEIRDVSSKARQLTNLSAATLNHFTFSLLLFQDGIVPFISIPSIFGSRIAQSVSTKGVRHVALSVVLRTLRSGPNRSYTTRLTAVNPRWFGGHPASEFLRFPSQSHRKFRSDGSAMITGIITGRTIFVD